MAMYPEQRMAQQLREALRRDTEVAGAMGIPVDKLAERVFVGLKENFVGPRTAMSMPFLEIDVILQTRTPYAEEGAEAISQAVVRCKIAVKPDHAERHQLWDILNTAARRLKEWQFNGFMAYPPGTVLPPGTANAWFEDSTMTITNADQRGMVAAQDMGLRCDFVVTRQTLGISAYQTTLPAAYQVET